MSFVAVYLFKHYRTKPFCIKESGSQLVSGIAFIIALFSTLPIVTWFLLLLIFMFILRQKRTAFNAATDITTFFAVTASVIISKQLWHQNYSGMAILIILVTALVYTLVFWRVRKEFEPKRIFRGIWRTTFLIFMISDFFLYLYGMISQYIYFT